jgi:hypothetical protein
MAEGIRWYKDAEQVKQALSSGVPDIRTTALLVSAEKSSSAPSVRSPCPFRPDAVTVVSYGINEIHLAVNTSCPGQFVSSEVMYPGWRATIDGKEVPIDTANLAFRSVFVPEGKHTIVFRYVPRIFLLGGGITFVTACLLVVAYRKKGYHHV